MDSWAAEHRARCSAATAAAAAAAAAATAAVAASIASGTSVPAGAPPPQPPGSHEVSNAVDDGSTPIPADGAAPPVLAGSSTQQTSCGAGASLSPIASGARAGSRDGGRRGSPLSVWTDLPYLSDAKTGLTRSEFVVLDCGVGASSPRDADVVWASSSIDPKFEAAMG